MQNIYSMSLHNSVCLFDNEVKDYLSEKLDRTSSIYVFFSAGEF